MRVIHSERNSRFLLRRSRYAYCPARMTASLAIRNTLLRRPRKPLARAVTFLWLARAVTPRLTLGMAYLLTRREAWCEQTAGRSHVRRWRRAIDAYAWSISWS